MMRSHLRRQARARGFTLLEILVALIVTAVGLLGLAKMQALALSATKEAGGRSLIALQAASLANIMYANEAYWATSKGPTAAFTISGTTIGNADLAGGVAGGCSAKCSALAMAASDVATWAASMNQQFPTYLATVSCSAWSATTPVNCLVYITWTEKQVAVSKNTASGAATQVTTQSYSVNVKP